MSNVLIIISFIIVAALEASLTTMPFGIVAILLFYLVKRTGWVFGIALLYGILLDVLALHALGISSLFFITFIFLITLYERKFEIVSYQFVFIATFLGAFFYLLITDVGVAFFQAFLVGIFPLFLFRILLHFNTKQSKEELYYLQQ